MSASFLSLVENDRSDIAIGRLVRLIEFYGISIADLLPGEGVSGSYPDVVTSTGRRRLHSQSEGIDVYLLTSMTRDRQMMPMLVEIEPGARLAEHGRHAGEEWVHVLEGRLRLELEAASRASCTRATRPTTPPSARTSSSTTTPAGRCG